MRAFKPTPPTVLALVALIFAMAGTGIAAKSYVISSSSQVKDGAITGRDIKKSTITGSNVKNKSLTAADFTGSIQGPKGDKGDAGLPGSVGPITYVTGRATVACTPNPIPPPDCSTQHRATAWAVCPAGQRPLGGGLHALGTAGDTALGMEPVGSTTARLIHSGPGSTGPDTMPNAWTVINESTGPTEEVFYAHAVCAKVPVAGWLG